MLKNKASNNWPNGLVTGIYRHAILDIFESESLACVDETD